MTRGLSIKTDRIHEALFWIIRNTSMSQYYWNIIENQAYSNKTFDPYFFYSRYSGKDLADTLEGHDYILIFLNIQAYIDDTEISKITTYEEFIKSNCKAIILIYDSIYMDIYQGC